MTLHSEDATQTLGSGLGRSSKVGGVGCQPQVVNLVLRRHDGESRVEQHRCPEDALIVFLACLTVVLEHLYHILPILALFSESLQLLHIIGIVEESVLAVPLVDDPAP